MQGDPTYIELGVRNADAARAFYGRLFGWTASGKTGPGQVHTSTLDIGLHDGDDATHFEVFFAVDDLDESLTTVSSLGGKVIGDVHDNPDFGRWAECVDDQGVRFGLRQSPS